MQERDLTLVGLTEDGRKLVLVSDSGEEFTLAADARLRAALRGEHARLGQLEITMESALRPRDIQARIRGGESPESVAAVAQTTLDRIMAYATPVLAERAHIADQAQRASVRRRSSESPARVLRDAVAERLAARNVDPESVEWDAWRREDGRWTLVADYHSGESPRHAEFVFDAPGRYVVAEDDEARWLVGEPTASRGPQPRQSGTRRLMAVGSDDEELPLGEDAIDLVSEPAPRTAAERPSQDRTSDWIATQATERPTPVELGSEADDADLAAAPVPDAGVGVGVGAGVGAEVGAEPAAEPDPAEDARAGAGQGPQQDAGSEAAAVDGPEAESESESESGSQAGSQAGQPRRTTKKSRRASVPSWDEIMFGGGKPD
jgi:hypothetical protein